MELHNSDLERIYLKAKAAFKKCVLCKENKFLKDEIDIPVDSIILREEFVRVQFCKSEVDSFTFEARIQLLSPDGKVVGGYSYYEDESGTALDDFLVFD